MVKWSNYFQGKNNVDFCCLSKYHWDYLPRNVFTATYGSLPNVLLQAIPLEICYKGPMALFNSGKIFEIILDLQFMLMIIKMGIHFKKTWNGLYHTETSPLIHSENQWTGFYMIGSSIIEELMVAYEWLTLVPYNRPS